MFVTIHPKVGGLAVEGGISADSLNIPLLILEKVNLNKYSQIAEILIEEARRCPFEVTLSKSMSDGYMSFLLVESQELLDFQSRLAYNIPDSVVVPPRMDIKELKSRESFEYPYSLPITIGIDSVELFGENFMTSFPFNP